MNEIFQKPVKDLTEGELREAHRIFWDWLAEHPEATKYGFFNESGIEHVPAGHCYACIQSIRNWREKHQDAPRIPISTFKCDYCPCVWYNIDGQKAKSCFSGVYRIWLLITDFEKRSELARKIRDAWPEK
jgi:hypothetical protein